MEDGFKFLINKLEDGFAGNEFLKDEVSENEVVFSRSEEEYKINLVNNIISVSNNNKVLCEWFFDTNSSKKDIETIVLDFSEAVFGRKKEMPSVALKNINRSDALRIDFFDFAEKMCRIFPDIKQDYDSEKSGRGDKFRKVKFVTELIVPHILEALLCKKEKNRIEKIFKNLCNSYIFGDEDTKCIITMAIFNRIESVEERKFVEMLLPKNMKKVWNASEIFIRNRKHVVMSAQIS